ncbi:TadE/TadG family type IV pilus assembly protein [Roseomonas sp. CAU 1739]|uniref:TadE/TadG family type IV pilus assembly protein n=1 Tax=Roseomonas sp. CAU 1739 TaxID=3140364 RepID=UPI00325B756E
MTQSFLGSPDRPRTAGSVVRSRRGGIAVAFAVGATAFLGMAALATEGGVWFAARRNAQTAADLAAYAGVAQLAWKGSDTAGQTAAISVGASVAATNSFATEVDPQTGAAGRTTVTVTPGLWAAGAFTASTSNPNAVQVTIAQTQRLGLAALISSTAPVVRVRAIAAIRDSSDACILSLVGQTTITGNNTINAPNCSVNSNRAGTSIDCGNSAQINVLAFRAVGTVASPCVGLAPITERQIPAADPYVHLQGVTLPTFQNNQCQNMRTNGSNPRITVSGGITTYSPLPYNMNSTGLYTTATAVCDDIRISTSTDRMVLVPGTYFFYGASLMVTGGTVSCPTCTGGAGVTLVFTGTGNGNNSIGNIKVTGGSVTLDSPTIGPWYNQTYSRLDPATGNQETTSIYDGIVIYRDVRASPNNSKQLDNMNTPNTAQIPGNSDSVNINGGIYLPSSQIFIAGNAAVSTNQSDCQSMVAATIQFTGNSGLSLDGCAARGTSVVHNRVLRLVQ